MTVTGNRFVVNVISFWTPSQEQRWKTKEKKPLLRGDEGRRLGPVLRDGSGDYEKAGRDHHEAIRAAHERSTGRKNTPVEIGRLDPPSDAKIKTWREVGIHEATAGPEAGIARRVSEDKG